MTSNVVFFDPRQVEVKINGEKVTGLVAGSQLVWKSGERFSYGYISLIGGLEWSIRLKELLGKEVTIELGYNNPDSPFSVLFEHKETVVVTGYTLTVSSEAPVVVFSVSGEKPSVDTYWKKQTER